MRNVAVMVIIPNEEKKAGNLCVLPICKYRRHDIHPQLNEYVATPPPDAVRVLISAG